MFEKKRVSALLLMAGIGSRFQSPIPKQFQLLDGKPIYQHALDTLKQTNYFDEILLVCHPDWHKIPGEKTIVGGKTRQESCYLGLLSFQKSPDFVLVHDAARPFVSQKIIYENLKQVLKTGAVNTCIPAKDTLVFSPDHTSIHSIPKRKDYLQGQTPQTFCYQKLLKAHKQAIQEGVLDATDDCSLICRIEEKVDIVMGDDLNFKITSPFDLKIAETLVLSKELLPSTSLS